MFWKLLAKGSHKYHSFRDFHTTRVGKTTFRCHIQMTDPKNTTASQRLTQIKDFLTMNKTATTIPWDPDSTKFPTRKELPQIPGAPPEAAWVWGDNDYVRPAEI